VVGRLAWFYDEPFGDSSAVPTYYLSGATRERVTVALSGDGGDETFAGYRRYVFAMLEDRVRGRVPEILRRGIVGPLARAYPKADYLPQFLRAKATLTNLSVSHERAYFLSLTQKSYPRFLAPDFLRGQRGYDPYVHFERHLGRAGTDDPLARLQYVDFKMYLADDILVKVDRASMAHALEVRVPILDHRVIELAARMPSSMKLAGRETKLVLKKVAAKLLPASTFQRKKMGFSIPLPEWFRSGLKARAEEIYFAESGGRSGVLDGPGLRRIWKEHQLGFANHATALWSILMFEGWARQFLTRAPPVRLTKVAGVEVAPTRVERVSARSRAV
jgi:asparagine synthase (glutamine-hydrolysing)